MAQTARGTQFVADKLNPISDSPVLTLRLGESTYLDPARSAYLGVGSFGKTFRIDGWLTEDYRSPFLDEGELARSTHPLACCLKLFNVHGPEQRQEVAHRVEMEYDWLRIAHGAGGHVPRPLALGHGVDDEGDFFGLVMEYLPTEDEDLSEGRAWRTLQSKRDVRLDITDGADRLLTPTETAFSVLSICRAVQAVHATGLVHRDIKPNNIAVHLGPAEVDAAEGTPRALQAINRVVLLDLGQATQSDSTVTVMYDTHSPRFASALYGAPELFDIDPGASNEADRYGPFWKYRNEAAVDVYAVGCLAYHLYTMRDPDFPLPSDTNSLRNRAMASKRAGLHLERRRGLSDRERAVEDVLADLIERCTVFDPRKRAAIARLDRLIASLEACLGLVSHGQAVQTILGLDLVTSDMGDWKGTTSMGGPAEVRVDTGQTTAFVGATELGTSLGDSWSEEGPYQDSSDFDRIVRTQQEALSLLDSQPADAANLLRALAQEHDYEPAWALLGRLFADGSASAEDPSELEHALRMAGRSGNADAWYRLGLIYRDGSEGISSSEADAFQCLGYAVDLGHGDAAFALGSMLLDKSHETASSVDAARFLDEAHLLFDTATRLGTDLGWVGMGFVYEDAGFSDHDLAKANACYQKALALRGYEARMAIAWGVGRYATLKRRAWYATLLACLFLGVALSLALSVMADTISDGVAGTLRLCTRALCAVPTFLVMFGLLFQRHGRQRNGALEIFLSVAALCVAVSTRSMLSAFYTPLTITIIALIIGGAWLGILLATRAFATRDHWIAG